MRILRGKSNLEVSSQGFAWFVVGLVLATFIGGAVRTILSSDRVHKRIVSELRARFPQHEFEIGKTEVLLSHGMWPGLGLRVRDLRFRQSVCGKLSFLLEVPEAVLPVDLLSLRKGRVRLGEVGMTNGKIHFDYRPCAPDGSDTIGVSSSPARDVPPLNQQLQKPSLNAASLDWRKVGEHLDAITLSNFTITYERNGTWKLVVKRAELDLDDDLSAYGALDVQKILPGGVLSHLVDFQAEGDDRVLKWGVHSEFKEGTINLKGVLDLNNVAGSVRMQARQLPLKDVMSELYQMGFLERDVRLKSTWLSCVLQWEGSLSKPADAPLRAQDCKLEGGYGRVDLENAEVPLDNPSTLKAPAVLKVQKLQLQPVLEALNRSVLPAVLARPGQWSGELNYQSPMKWTLDGHLENLEVVFSNRSVRGKQMLERLHTEIKKDGARIEAKIDELRVQGGEFAGVLRAALQDDWRSGDFEAQIEKLRLNPSIQYLLVGGTIGELKLKGTGQLVDGELGHWEGQGQLGEIRGNGWQALNVSVHSRFKANVFGVEARAASMQIDSKWVAYPQVKSINPSVGNEVVWKDGQAKLDIKESGGVVHSASAIEETRKNIPWKIKGNWVRDGDLIGILNVGHGSKPPTFVVRGEKDGGLSVQPR